MNCPLVRVSPCRNACQPAQLYDAPVEHIVSNQGAEHAKIKKTLQTIARRCRLLIIATDNDREGESIGFEIIEVCSEVNPRIVSKRMKFSALTPRDIRNAIARLAVPDKNASDVSCARVCIDVQGVRNSFSVRSTHRCIFHSIPNQTCSSSVRRAHGQEAHLLRAVSISHSRICCGSGTNTYINNT